jgi:hypothetical protein
MMPALKRAFGVLIVVGALIHCGSESDDGLLNGGPGPMSSSTPVAGTANTGQSKTPSPGPSSTPPGPSLDGGGLGGDARAALDATSAPDTAKVDAAVPAVDGGDPCATVTCGPNQACVPYAHGQALGACVDTCDCSNCGNCGGDNADGRWDDMQEYCGNRASSPATMACNRPCSGGGCIPFGSVSICWPLEGCFSL